MGEWRWENGDGKRKIKKDIMLHSNFQFSTFNFQLKKGLSPFFLIPLYIALSLTPLLPLQILQDTGIGTNFEIIIFPTPER